MKPKLLLGLALVLSGGLLGWLIVKQQRANAFLERLHPPSVEQVKQWAGFPEDTHLTLLTNVPNEVAHVDDASPFAAAKWFWMYEDRKGSNYTRVLIAVFEPGGFWPAKRDLLIGVSEQNHKKFSEQKHPDKGNAVYKEWEAMDRELSPMTMPDGVKSYGFLFGLAPGRFASHANFDVVACMDIEPPSYDQRNPPADLTVVETNPFTEFFTNMDAFIMSQ